MTSAIFLVQMQTNLHCLYRQCRLVCWRKALVTISLSNIYAYLPIDNLKMPLRTSQSYDPVVTVW